MFGEKRQIGVNRSMKQFRVLIEQPKMSAVYICPVFCRGDAVETLTGHSWCRNCNFVIRCNDVERWHGKLGSGDRYRKFWRFTGDDIDVVGPERFCSLTVGCGVATSGFKVEDDRGFRGREVSEADCNARCWFVSQISVEQKGLHCGEVT